jgi:hypothetical protein
MVPAWCGGFSNIDTTVRDRLVQSAGQENRRAENTVQHNGVDREKKAISIVCSLCWAWNAFNDSLEEVQIYTTCITVMVPHRARVSITAMLSTLIKVDKL